MPGAASRDENRVARQTHVTLQLKTEAAGSVLLDRQAVHQPSNLDTSPRPAISMLPAEPSCWIGTRTINLRPETLIHAQPSRILIPFAPGYPGTTGLSRSPASQTFQRPGWSRS